MEIPSSPGGWPNQQTTQQQSQVPLQQQSTSLHPQLNSTKVQSAPFLLKHPRSRKLGGNLSQQITQPPVQIQYRPQVPQQVHHYVPPMQTNQMQFTGHPSNLYANPSGSFYQLPTQYVQKPCSFQQQFKKQFRQHVPIHYQSADWTKESFQEKQKRYRQNRSRYPKSEFWRAGSLADVRGQWRSMADLRVPELKPAKSMTDLFYGQHSNQNVYHTIHGGLPVPEYQRDTSDTETENEEGFFNHIPPDPSPAHYQLLIDNLHQSYQRTIQDLQRRIVRHRRRNPAGMVKPLAAFLS